MFFIWLIMSEGKEKKKKEKNGYVNDDSYEIIIEETLGWAMNSFDVINKIRERINDMIALSGVLANVVLGLQYFLMERGFIKTSYTQYLLILTAISYLIVTILGIIVWPLL